MKKLIFGLIVLGIITTPVLALTYEQMARYPEEHIGESITITGKVEQVIYTDDGCLIRMVTGKGKYIDWVGDDLFVLFSGSLTNGRILEGDIVQITGSFFKPYQYETIFGATREIPLIIGDSYILNPVYTNF